MQESSTRRCLLRLSRRVISPNHPVRVCLPQADFALPHIPMDRTCHIFSPRASRWTPSCHLPFPSAATEAAVIGQELWKKWGAKTSMAGGKSPEGTFRDWLLVGSPPSMTLERAKKLAAQPHSACSRNDLKTLLPSLPHLPKTRRRPPHPRSSLSPTSGTKR